MIKHPEIQIADQDLSRWQKLRVWLTALDEAFDYDPQTHIDATIRQLSTTVARLETRLSSLEQQHQPPTNLDGRR